MNIKTTNAWIADRIREAVQKEHTTEKATADAALIPWTTWYRRMRGSGSFDWDELMRIATALNRPPSFFTPPQFQQDKEAA
ncbi:helix-turn-helix domain-containing protein [Varibaculum cambriense]|uniref:XRE family transcriptional regulator n=1 Tax=Varibaculum cambriense TaxID=184870 RepID=A0ABX4URS1_9ACTO|nr:helix-turn-helix transcriptional regulator [Varibaculum cambriense]PMB89243.1 hypothetical protein CJ240_05615 [Varibaculum cambriense]